MALRGSRFVVWTAAVFTAYQLLIAVVLVLGLGGSPNYLRTYAIWDNARRIVALTPDVRDVVSLVGREPIVEYGRLHPHFRAAVWSFELTWSRLLFYLSFSALLGLYFALGRRGQRGWGLVGSVGGAGLVGLLGASVSSLTHCGLGSFGIFLSVAGVSATTIALFGRLEPLLIPLGYGLIVAAIVSRARAEA